MQPLYTSEDIAQQHEIRGHSPAFPGHESHTYQSLLCVPSPRVRTLRRIFPPRCAESFFEGGICAPCASLIHLCQIKVILMKFHSLAAHTHQTTAVLPRHHEHEAGTLTDSDPAISVMADFANACPLTVEPGRSIDAALQDMIDGGVRTLLVLTKGTVTGLITAYDIQGQKPLQFLHGSDCIHPNCRRQDIEVADIMTPVEDLPTLQLADVLKARIGDLLETFRETRQTHLLVTDRQDDEHTVVRGLISRTRIEQRLGISPILASAACTEQELSAFLRPVVQG